ncbi:MAG TPA: MFS transporter [Actinophytocola sp.]|uniref:MFS transporter n=1 Tax=Actinophytocola sp. TaxID=1872138 RepID=UPI002DBDB219|nr:MFS transporter [Actinophytocola sp.]HEU5474342.1 MFS transporter [Actinophytocola sp.]
MDEQNGSARARWAVAGLFFIVGIVLSTWFTRIPQFKSGLSLSDAELTVALLAPTVGALTGMQFAGRLTARYGSAPIARVATVLAPLALVVPAAAGDLTIAILGLLVFGIVDGITDVAVNAQGVAVERALRRPVLSGMHAAWGIGAIVGALSGAAAIAAGLTVLQHFAAMAAGTVAVALVAGSQLLPAGVDRSQTGGESPKPKRSWRSGWTRRVLGLGLLGGAAMLCEGAISNWSAVFLQDELAATAAVASLGYSVFTVVETGTRLVGDSVRGRIGPVLLVRVSVALAIAGLALVLLGSPADTVWLAIVGFGVLGAGLATLNPIVFSAVGHGSVRDAGSADAAGEAIAHYTTMSYGGVLAGPAVVGWLSGGIGLTGALACLFVPLLGIAMFARLTASAEPVVKPSS